MAKPRGGPQDPPKKRQFVAQTPFGARNGHLEGKISQLKAQNGHLEATNGHLERVLDPFGGDMGTTDPLGFKYSFEVKI